ncbi:MAG: ABC transporter permease [Deltaproteobacteria bacterium]|nr:ABC transporter permease [Deltaproteobacteria bacterium]
MRTASFRLDFWLRFIMDSFYYLSNIVFVFVVYSRVSTINTWEYSDYLVLLSILFLVDSYQMTFISSNCWSFPSNVNTGKFDYYLLKPINTFFFTFFNTVEVSSFLNFVFSLPFAFYVGYINDFSAKQILTFILVVVLGCVICSCLRILIALYNLWSHSPYGLERLWVNLYNLMSLPDAVFPSALRILFTFLLPILLVAAIPAKAIKENSIDLVKALILACFILCVLVAQVWRTGLRFYTSASS